MLWRTSVARNRTETMNNTGPQRTSGAFGPPKRRRTDSRRRSRNSLRLSLERLEDRRLLMVDLASVTSLPTPLPREAGNEYSTNPAINADGRYVAYQSQADNLVAAPVDSNGTQDVYVYDRLSRSNVLISVNAAGTAAGSCEDTLCAASLTAGSYTPSISDDGRFVAFVSRARDLVKDVTIDIVPNVYVRDRDADEDGIFDEPGEGESVTRLLSIGADGTAAGVTVDNNFVGRPVISADGTAVVFSSFATDMLVDDLTITDSNGLGADVYRASTLGGAVTRINVDGSGAGTGAGSGTVADLTVSATGGVVGFGTTNSGLISAATGTFDDANGAPDVFVGSGNAPVELVSVNAAGTGPGNGGSREPALSRNGRHVAFFSSATDLVSGVTDDNLGEDLFVRDLLTGSTALLSHTRDGGAPTSGDAATPPFVLVDSDYTAGPSLSASGRFVAFRSAADNLLETTGPYLDENGLIDIFLYDRDSDADGIFDEVGATTTTLVTHNAARTGPADHAGSGLSTAGSSAPSLSSDGRFLAYASTGRDLTSDGLTPLPGSQVYLYDRLTDSSTLISRGTFGVNVGPDGTTPPTRQLTLSANGSAVAFQTDLPASDLDSTVVDPANSLPVPFGEIDVFVGSPEGDLTLVKNYAGGADEHVQGFRILFDEIAPFEISYYRSLDDAFDASDVLLGSTTVTESDLLSPTEFTQALFTTIGSGDGEVPFPGVSATDPLEDYFILAVGDPGDLISEFDEDPFNEDNTDPLRGVYFVSAGASGPLFVHGSEASETAAATVSETFDLTFGVTGSGASSFTYPAAEVTAARVRLHGGDDTFSGSEIGDVAFGGEGRDLLDGLGGDDSLFGGAGGDRLLGGAGNDLIDGGAGPDNIMAGAGDDLVLDGPGDDVIDVGEGDDTILATPGSDDIFIADFDGNDTLSFDLFDGAIEMDLDSESKQLVDGENTITLQGLWENFVGTDLDDHLTLRPVPATPRRADGGDGTDRLIVDAGGNVTVNDGTTLSFPGTDLGDISIVGFEDIQVINFVPQVPIIDNGDAGFSSDSFTPIGDPANPQGFDGDIAFANSDDGASTATWTFAGLPPAQYFVSATWTRANDRATDAAFAIQTETGATTVRVNQEQPAAEFDDQGFGWSNLGLFEVGTGGQLTVQLTDDANENVIADAIRIEPYPFAGDSRILDDVPNRSGVDANKTVFRATNAAGNLPLLGALSGFANAIGGSDNGNQVGPLNGGLRQINWDDVPAGADQAGLPADFYNTVQPRGLVIQTDGEIRVSGTGDPGSPFDFEDFNNSYPFAFGAFSFPRMVTPVGSNVTEIRFFVPGTSTPAAVPSFGAVFSDVDRDFETEIAFFGVDGQQLTREFVDAAPGDAQFSFLGVNYETPLIASVQITSGDEPITFTNSPDDVSLGSDADLVVLDDFIFGEPRAIVTPDGNGFSSDGLAESGRGFLSDQTALLPDQSANWTFSDLPPNRTFVVSTTWTPAQNRNQAATYTIGGVEVVKDQQQPPNDFLQAGSSWEQLAKIRTDGNVLPITLTGDPLQFADTIADAIQLVPGADLQVFDPQGNPIANGATVDLGQIPLNALGETDRPFPFVIRNRDGAGVLELNGFGASGAGLSRSTGFATNLPAAAETAFDLLFQTTGTGSLTGQVSFQTNDFEHPNFSFNVIAEAVADNVPPTIDELENSWASSHRSSTDNRSRFAVASRTTFRAARTTPFRSRVERSRCYPTETFEIPDLTAVTPLIVRVTDGAGNFSEETRSLSLQADQPPTVKIVSPFDGDGFVEGSTITLQVEADDDVQLRRVEFYAQRSTGDGSHGGTVRVPAASACGCWRSTDQSRCIRQFGSGDQRCGHGPHVLGAIRGFRLRLGRARPGRWPHGQRL